MKTFQKREKMETYIPEDLLINIMIGLPVKSLLRFKSVCKKWCLLIETVDFVEKHLQYQKLNNKGRLLLTLISVDGDNEKYVYFKDDAVVSTINEEREYIRSNQETESGGIFGPVNGLFGFHGYRDNIRIWNPSTRKYRALPRFLPLELDYVSCVVGFGFDTLSVDYKVLFLRKSISLMVYSLLTNTWKQLDRQHYDNGITKNLTDSSLYLHGVCYWRKPWCSAIITFDMSKEVFGEIKGPDTLSVEPYWSPFIDPSPWLTVCNDLLMWVLRPNQVDTIHTWVMEEDGIWIKRFSFNIPCELDLITCAWLKNKDEIILGDPKGHELSKAAIVFNHTTQQIVKEIVPVGDYFHFESFAYYDSLQPVTSRNDVNQI